MGDYSRTTTVADTSWRPGGVSLSPPSSRDTGDGARQKARELGLDPEQVEPAEDVGALERQIDELEGTLE